jgi:hypothetical protein
MLKINRLVVLLATLLGFCPTFAQDTNEIFIYQVDSEISQIRWFSVDTPEQVTAVDVPTFATYAISPDGIFVAFKANGRDGFFYILNFTDQSLISIQLYEPTLEFLSDGHYLTSGTMLWSPDSHKLALTGEVPPLDAQTSTVYIYDVQTGELNNVTQNVPIVRSLIIPSSWSPDSQWLIVNGAWSVSVNDQGYTVPDFGSALVSVDGTTFNEIAPNFGTCRLEWSPDMHWLASDTACLVGVGESSALRLIPFDIDTLEDEHSIDQVIYPFDIQPSAGWSSRYSTPLWIDSETFMAFRSMTPLTFGYFSDNTLSSSGLIRYNINTYSETFFLEGDYDLRLGDWFVSRDSAYNPRLDKLLQIPWSILSCPASYALRLDSSGSYIAVMNVCYPPDSEEPYTLRLYETETFSELVSMTMGEDELFKPLGFVER